MARIRAMQNVLKVQKDGTTRFHVHASCENTIREMRACKWPDKQPEEKEKAEIELPLTKFFQMPAALSYVVGFCENMAGGSIYAAQC